MRRMVTGKSLTIKLTGKRHVGDEGNDYLAGLAWSTGADCNSQLEWTMPSGAKLKYDCVVNVVNPGGGESRDVAPLEVELLSDGQAHVYPCGSRLILALVIDRGILFDSEGELLLWQNCMH